MPMYRECPVFGLAKRATEEQWAYADSIYDNLITFSNSGAGTGKTTWAVAMAKYLIDTYPNKYKKARYIFNPVMEERQGYLPGNQRLKDAPYLVPLKQALLKINEDPFKSIIMMDDEGNELNNGWFYAHSSTYERGVNYEEEIVIVEEAQNYTHHELKKILTRLHDNSKGIIIGHTGQIDLENPNLSGFYDYVEHFRPTGYAGHRPLTKDFRGVISRHADRLGIDFNAKINEPY